MEHRFKKVLITTAIVSGALAAITTADACSGFIIGKALTADGSFLYGRTEDYPYKQGDGNTTRQHTHNKNFIVNPAKDYKEGEVFTDQSTGFTYPRNAHEYKYTSVSDDSRDTPEGVFDEHGFNEYGVSMTATLSATPRKDILAVDPLVENGIAEAGMTTTILPKIKTAREGVELLAKIIDEKGSAEGNNIIFADKNELWYMEIYSGHQYVAFKYPADKFSVMPNTYFLGAIDLDNADTVVHSKGIVETAKKAGSYTEQDGKMHLALSYAPVLHERNRSRQYAGIKLLNPESKVTYSDKFYEFLQDTPRRNYTAMDGIAVQRNRFETLKEGFVPDDTVPGYDFYNDYTPVDNVDALPEAERAKYKYAPGNENVVDPHVYQINPDLPMTLGGTMWLGLSRSRNTPFVPYFGNIQDTYKAYQVRGGEYSPDSWYWVADNIDKMVTEHKNLFGDTIKKHWMEVEQLLADYHNKLIEQYKHTTDDYVAATAEEYTANSMKVAERVFSLMKIAEANLDQAIKENHGLNDNFLDLTELKDTLATLKVREPKPEEKVAETKPETKPDTTTEVKPETKPEDKTDTTTEAKPETKENKVGFTVMDATTKKPLANVTIDAMIDGKVVSATTDDKGYVSFFCMPGQKIHYRIAKVPAGYNVDLNDYELTAGEAVPALTLTPDGTAPAEKPTTTTAEETTTTTTTSGTSTTPTTPTTAEETTTTTTTITPSTPVTPSTTTPSMPVTPPTTVEVTTNAPTTVETTTTAPTTAEVTTMAPTTKEAPTTTTTSSKTTSKELPNTGVADSFMGLGTIVSGILVAAGISLPKIKKDK